MQQSTKFMISQEVLGKSDGKIYVIVDTNDTQLAVYEKGKDNPSFWVNKDTVYRKPSAKALDVQVGGGHYKDMPIQPIEFCYKNKLDCCQTKIIKYVCRHTFKGGVEDLDKAIHMLEVYKELAYGEDTEHTG